jgi:tRNA G18 (ribose-2'-O)-methylase SpoU
MVKLNAKQLRKTKPENGQLDDIKRTPLVIVLDNVTDTFNIGSFFRLAEALSVEKIILGGESVTPPNPKIHRSSVGTWRWLEWEHRKNTAKAIEELKKSGYFIVSVEQTPKSISYWELSPKFPVALVLGNETRGINQKILDISDAVVELPMLGVNKSLNVFASGSVISYFLLQKLSGQNHR